MTKFIKLKDREYGDTLLINIDNISEISVEAETIVVNGNSGKGNGLIHLEKESFNCLYAEINNNYTVVQYGIERGNSNE